MKNTKKNKTERPKTAQQKINTKKGKQHTHKQQTTKRTHQRNRAKMKVIKRQLKNVIKNTNIINHQTTRQKVVKGEDEVSEGGRSVKKKKKLENIASQKKTNKNAKYESTKKQK